MYITGSLLELFRPSRPDFIETPQIRHTAPLYGDDCSGLLGRTSLRLTAVVAAFEAMGDCSGLLGRTSLRQGIGDKLARDLGKLFRPSRPDFIETS